MTEEIKNNQAETNFISEMLTIVSVVNLAAGLIRKPAKWLSLRTPYPFIDAIIAGLPHSGKTELSQALSSQNKIKKSETSQDAEYLLSWKNEICLVVMPGQTPDSNREFSFRKALSSALPKKKGLIYVVNNGFQGFWHESSLKAMQENKKIKSIKDLREQNKKSEIDHFKETLKTLNQRDLSLPAWIMIVANKYDLYSDECEEELINYYDPSKANEFYNALNEEGFAAIPTCFFKVYSYSEAFKLNNEIIEPKPLINKNKHYELIENIIKEIKQLKEKKTK